MIKCPVCGKEFKNLSAASWHFKRVLEHLHRKGVVKLMAKDRRRYVVQINGKVVLGLKTSMELLAKEVPGFSCNEVMREWRGVRELVQEILSRQKGTEVKVVVRKIARQLGINSSYVINALAEDIALSAPPQWSAKVVRYSKGRVAVIFTKKISSE